MFYNTALLQEFGGIGISRERYRLINICNKRNLINSTFNAIN